MSDEEFVMIKPETIQQWMDLAWKRAPYDRQQAIVFAVNGLTVAVQELMELLPPTIKRGDS